jgi:hypothetical protein
MRLFTRKPTLSQGLISLLALSAIACSSTKEYTGEPCENFYEAAYDCTVEAAEAEGEEVPELDQDATDLVCDVSLTCMDDYYDCATDAYAVNNCSSEEGVEAAAEALSACTMPDVTSEDCAEDSDTDGTETETGTETGTETETDGAFAPQEGAWMTAGDETIITDTCEFPEEEGEETEEEGDDDGMMVAMVDETTFTFTPIADEEAPTFTCTLDGMAFMCEALSGDMPFEGMDATMSMTMTISGEFTSATAGSINNKMDSDCSGADCASLAEWGFTFPCSVESTFPIAAQ